MSESIDYNVELLDQNLGIVFAIYSIAYREDTNGYSTRKGQLTNTFKKWVETSKKGRLFIKSLEVHHK